MIKETIHLALTRKLGREPTPAELKADVQRIIADGVMAIVRGESTPYKFTRTMTDAATDSPRYRADMIGAGRGRLVR